MTEPRTRPDLRPAVVAEVVRSGFVEGRHYGSVVWVDPAGSVLWSVGDVDSAMFPRSSSKPLQVVGMLRCGLDLPPELLALAAASHSAEDFHVDGVRRILDGAGLDESALQTPPDHSLEDRLRDEALRSGVEPSPIRMNCSGKHAAMLATCVVNGWDVDSYLDPAHPLQVAIQAAIEDLTGVAAVATAVDGCGAPLLSTSLTGLAQAFRRLALAEERTPERHVAAAYRQHPEYASGTRRDEARLLRALPGAIGKGGAEGCYAVALPDGHTVALKVDDGAARARPVVMTAALRRLGVRDPVLDELGEHTLYGGGRPVGVVRAALG